MSLLIQQIINGVFNGAIYALVASGLAVIFGILGVVNFAHGEMYMVGGYVAYFLLSKFEAPYALAIILTIALMAIFGAIYERIVIRPVLNRPFIQSVLTTLAAMLILQNGFIYLFSAKPRMFVPVYAGKSIEFYGIHITTHRLLISVVAVATFLLLQLIMKKTRIGKAMRAVSQNKEACASYGIQPAIASRAAFAMSGLLAGLAGVLMTPIVPVVPTMGMRMLLKAFAAVVVGGLGNVQGAIYSSILLGIIESLGAGYISSGFRDTFAFVIIVLVLMFRPEGIFGAKVRV